MYGRVNLARRHGVDWGVTRGGMIFGSLRGFSSRRGHISTSGWLFHCAAHLRAGRQTQERMMVVGARGLLGACVDSRHG